ncbi:MAG: hypothetical protein HYV14_14870 [Elusimicrobia bacterium]|nr:hypothetical protein [Elusimicrobiota bacterium]
MLKNLAVALTLTFVAALAGAQPQTTQHYETADEGEPSEDVEEPQAQPPEPAPRPERPARPIFSGRPSAASARTQSSGNAAQGGGASADPTSSDSCAAVACSEDFPLKDSSGRCYHWAGASCRQLCLNGDTNNCLRPGYSEGECLCSYPVDFSPAYEEECIGNPQKVFQPGKGACTPSNGDRAPSGGARKPEDPSAGSNTAANCPAPPAGTLLYSTAQRDNYTPRNFHYAFNTPGMPLDSKVLAGKPKAYAFVNKYTPASKRGGRVATEDGNRGSGLKDMAISECPGQFSGVPAGCAVSRTLTGGVYWTYDGSKYAKMFNACRIEPGRTYYLNIRTSGIPEAGFLLYIQ